MSGVKFLIPPFKLAGRSTFIEDREKRRWTAVMRRAMKHGTYDWTRHEEKSA